MGVLFLGNHCLHLSLSLSPNHQQYKISLLQLLRFPRLMKNA
jgi:hypothetical protein